MKTLYSIILAICLFLTGCGADKAAPDAKEKQQTKILAPHVKTLNQAKDMGKTLQEAEAARKKKMDEQEEPVEDEDPI